MLLVIMLYWLTFNLLMSVLLFNDGYILVEISFFSEVLMEYTTYTDVFDGTYIQYTGMACG